MVKEEIKYFESFYNEGLFVLQMFKGESHPRLLNVENTSFIQYSSRDIGMTYLGFKLLEITTFSERNFEYTKKVLHLQEISKKEFDSKLYLLELTK